MLTKIRNVLVILCCLPILYLSLMAIPYLSQKLLYEGISYDIKRNQLSTDSTPMQIKDIQTDEEGTKWAKRTVTFTFATGVEEYQIGINTNGFLVAKKIR